MFACTHRRPQRGEAVLRHGRASLRGQRACQRLPELQGDPPRTHQHCHELHGEEGKNATFDPGLLDAVNFDRRQCNWLKNYVGFKQPEKIKKHFFGLERFLSLPQEKQDRFICICIFFSCTFFLLLLMLFVFYKLVFAAKTAI